MKETSQNKFIVGWRHESTEILHVLLPFFDALYLLILAMASNTFAIAEPISIDLYAHPKT